MAFRRLPDLAASRISSLALIALSGLLAAASCGPAPESSSGAKKPANVLLVTLDTLRADRLGSYGYPAARTPHLDALAGRGARFSQATTVTPLTLPAHASLMTGTFPAFHGVRDNGGYYLEDGRVTLAETLSGAGLRTGGFVGAFVLDSRWGIAQGFEEFFDDFDLGEFEGAAGMDAIQRSGSVVVDRTLAWIRAEPDRPFFAWAHLYDPHTPYEAPEPYRSRFPATRSGAYDAEISWTDAQVGRLLTALDEAGRLDSTLVVVLGDHGEMLGEHDEVTHGFFIYDAAVRIPLILAGPGIPRTELDAQVRITDVMPTILAALGLTAPVETQGEDLARLWRGEGLRLLALSESWFPRLHYGWSELTSIQDGRYKLIRAPTRELYDLSVDPGETANLAAGEPQRADRMEEALERLLADVSSGEVRPPAAIDEDTAQRLQALGYLGGRTSLRHLEEAGGPDGRADPKDKIGLYNLLKLATTASASGDHKTAISRVSEALAADPEIVEAHLLLGNFHRKAKAWDSAAAAYRRALELDPEFDEALYSLALTYKRQERLEDALAGFERAASLDPRSGKILWEKADTLMRLRRFAEAERELLGALDLDLDRPRFLLKLGACYVEMKRPGEALPRLREALGEDSDLPLAQYTLGLALEDLRRPSEAAAAYRAELAAHPETGRASFNLAKLLAAAGQPREAVEFFRRTTEAQPDFGTAYLYLAKSLLDLGDLEGAEAAARTGLARQPAADIAPLGHYVLADVYNRLGRISDAERESAAGQRLQREIDRDAAGSA